MNTALVDVMTSANNPLPAAYRSAETIAALSTTAAQETGFEAVAVPFCMTLEAEVLGSAVDLGTLVTEAKIRQEAFASVGEATVPHLAHPPAGSRAERVIEAISLARRRHPSLPVVAGLTGPISTAASVVEPMRFLKDLRREPEACHRLLESVTDLLIMLGGAMVEAGADVIGISDPTATGEILGPRSFSAFAHRWLDTLLHALRKRGVPAIVHICGSLASVER